MRVGADVGCEDKLGGDVSAGEVDPGDVADTGPAWLAELSRDEREDAIELPLLLDAFALDP